MEPDLDQITSTLEALHARVSAARDDASTEEMRQQLGALQAALGEGKARFADEYRRVMTGLNRQISDAKQSAAATLEAVKEARAKIAAAKAAAKAPKPAAPPPPPEPPVDPTLGQRLRVELLQRFGDRVKPSPGQHEPDRDIWEDWSSDG